MAWRREGLHIDTTTANLLFGRCQQRQQMTQQASLRLAADQLCNPLIGKTGTEVELQHPFSAPEGIAGVTEVGERERSLLGGIVAGQ